VSAYDRTYEKSVSRGLFEIYRTHNRQNRNLLKRCVDAFFSVEWSGIPCQVRPSPSAPKTSHTSSILFYDPLWRSSQVVTLFLTVSLDTH